MDKSTSSITLITQEEIEQTGASNLSELMQSVSGIYLSPNGSSASIRGMDHSDTLFLIDGKRVLGEFSKKYELERISTGSVERVEVLKGSASLLYGSDAMGGVINIITKKPKEGFGGSISVMGGKQKKAVDIALQGFEGSTGYSLFMNYLDRDSYNKRETTDVGIMHQGTAKAPSDPTLPNSGGMGTLKGNLNDSYTYQRDYQSSLETKNIGGSINHFVNDAIELQFDGSYMQEDKKTRFINERYATNFKQGGNTVMAADIPATEVDDNERTTLGAAIVYIPTNAFEIEYGVSYAEYKKLRKITTPLFDELGYATQADSLTGYNRSTLKQYNHELDATYDLSSHSSVLLGVGYKEDEVESSAYEKDLDKTSLYAMHEYGINKDLDIVYGARYDNPSIGDDQVSLSVALGYDLLASLRLRSSFSQGYKAPDTRDLFVEQISPSGKAMLGSTITNADKTESTQLQSETSDTAEVGLLHFGQNYRIDVAAFHTKVADKIQRVQRQSAANPGVSYFTFDNINKVEISGVETSMQYRVFAGFDATLSYTSIDAKNKTDNEKLSFTPKELASLQLRYELMSGLVISSNTRYAGEQVDVVEDKKYGGFSVTNIDLNYAVKKDLELFAGVDNVFEKQTHKDLGLSPTAAYYAGLRYTF
ncbi:MAG: TonB-dependent receptor plug domain-containing protein [Campylobacterota bacterium]